MLRRAVLWLTALGAPALAIAFVGLEPEGALTGAALRHAGVALGATLAWGLAALGAGAAALQKVDPDLLTDELGAAQALVAGMLLWGLGGLGLAATGHLDGAGMLALGLLMGAGWLSRPRLHLPRPGPVVLGALLVLLGVGLIDALAPPSTTDELYYQLAIPRLLLRHHGLVGGLLHPDGSRPLTLHLPYAMLMHSGGDSAPRLFHLGISAVVLVSAAQLARRLGHSALAAATAALLLISSWSFTHEAGLAANNLPVALAVLAALDAGQRGRWRGLALASGAALSLKYTAAGPILAVFLISALPWRRRVPAGLLALALVSPWWIRNLAEGLHPLFPYAGWPGTLQFQFLDKYGAGRSPVDMLLLPWNAVMTAELHSFRFLGRLNPVWLALVPAALWAALRTPLSRKLGLASVIIGATWAFGPHWLRHLLPGLPILAITLGVALAALGPVPRLVRAALLLSLFAGLPANWGPLLERAADRLPAATGSESRAEYLARAVPGWTATEWANEHLPDDARVAIFFAWTTALLDRDTVLGSVEDHVPTRHWLLTHGDQSLEALRSRGVTHVMVGRVRFLPKVYPFLSADQLQREFNGPVEQLDELLLMQATLIFQGERLRIYRL